jgi:hypothetical protein
MKTTPTTTPNNACRDALRDAVSSLLSGLDDGFDATPMQCQVVIALALAQIAEALAQPATEGAVLVRAYAR